MSVDDDVAAAYGSPKVLDLLGTVVSDADPDKTIIEPWAAGISGPILDVGSGTGRWTGRLAELGHNVVGLEPAEVLVATAQNTFPNAQFEVGTISDLRKTTTRWDGILAWYSLIHLDAEPLAEALNTLHGALTEQGSMLFSFFSGPNPTPFAHPITTAYVWPMADMRKLVEDAGFTVMNEQWTPGAPHAMMTAVKTHVV